jgi:Ca2+-binding RTX toxin-like protein
VKRVVFIASLVALLVMLFGGLALADVLFGTSGNDTIEGTERPDLIYGRAGHDRIFGYGERDTINGNLGNDLLYGGRGIDILYGAAGNDRLYIWGDGDRDHAHCGAGLDVVYRSGPDHNADAIDDSCEVIKNLNSSD